MKDDRLYLGHLQIMGEAVKKISADTRAAHPEVPWKDIAAMRHRVVHDYFGVSLEIVWDVVKTHLPPLRERLAAILPRD